MKRFVYLAAMSLGLTLGALGGGTSLGQSTLPYRIVIGQTDVPEFRQGSTGTLPVYLQTSDLSAAHTQLGGFSLAFDFNYVSGGTTTPSPSFFMSPTPTVTSSYSPSVSIQTGGAGTNYDVIVKWAAVGGPPLDLTATNPIKLFDLAFAVAPDSPLVSPDPFTSYQLSYLPNATQSSGTGGGPIGINELIFGNLETVSLTGANSGSSGGNFGVSAVPEPASIALCGLGASLAAAGAWRRRRKGPALEAASLETGTLTSQPESEPTIAS